MFDGIPKSCGYQGGVGGFEINMTVEIAIFRKISIRIKTHFHHLTALILCLLLANQAFAQPAPETKTQRQPIREVTLSGTGYELGLQHGQIFKKEIGAKGAEK